jgi:hypothetical protein
MPNIQEEFQEYIWDLLREDTEFVVGRNNEGGQLSLGEIIADLRGDSPPNVAVDEPASLVADQEGVENGNGTKPKKTEWKVYASEARRWRALTGHGIDYKRVHE